MNERIDALRSLLPALERRGPEAAVAAGDLWRRAAALEIDPKLVDGALRALELEAVRSAAAAVSVREIEEALVRAADEAIETAFAETAEERELWAVSALEGLLARDRAESVCAAGARREALGLPLDAATRTALRSLEEALRTLDRTLRPKARWFTGVNARRRTERDLLDDPHRAGAWWFSSRAECDDLLPQLSGQVSQQGPHLRQCSDCQRDLERSRQVDAPVSTPHLSADDAWRYDLQQMDDTERARVEEHASTCDECAMLIDALAAGERTIEELEQDQRAPAPPSATTGHASTRRPGRHLVAAQTEFRLVLVRDPGRVRLIVKPLSGRGLAAAAVSLPPYRTALQARQTEEGWEFELGPGEPLVGKSARVMVRLPDGSPFERDVEL